MRRASWIFGGLLLLLLCALLANMARHSSKQIPAQAGAEVTLDADKAAAKLAQLLEIPTVSHLDAARNDRGAFDKFRQSLTRMYPNIHGKLTREEINGSLLYRWPGSDVALAPVLLMAHFDVVPGEEGGQWTHSPFSGALADGFIWGRGALDMKGSLAAIMEAVESLVGEGFQPKRTVLLALGHDEELGGQGGNKEIAQRLKAQGVKLHAVLDEGSVVAVNLVPNVAKPVALVGIAEKGYLTLELSVTGEGGHGSMPAAVTNVEILSRALLKVVGMRNSGMLTRTVRDQLHWLAPELPFLRRMVLSNLWLFEPLVKRQMSAKPSGDAMLRTTIAPTMLQGSQKDNVLPHRVAATINFRLLQGTDGPQVIGGVRKAIADDRVQISQVGNVASDPSAISDIEGEAFDTLHRSIRESFPDVLVAPSLVLGATDSRHYRDITSNIYRFIPVRLGPEDLPRFHGKDERLSIKHYAEAIYFYTRYLRRQ